MISTTEFRVGAKIEMESEPFVIVEFQHYKPGKGSAIVRTRLKSLKTGNVLERSFRSGDVLPEPEVEDREMQFLYAQARECHFMDSKTYEQLVFDRAQLGDNADLLKENMDVRVVIYKSKPLTVELPNFIELKIAKTDPGVRGDTATGGGKQAVLESGASVKVPLYLEEGDLIRIDTRTRTFVERVK